MPSKYPYFLKPDIDALPTAAGDARRAIVRKIAAGIGSRDALRLLLGIDPEEFRDFYGENHAQDVSTEDTINAFIGRFAPSRAHEMPDEIPIDAPAADYAATLSTLPDLAPEDSTTACIDAFCGKENPPLSADLVKIMIKNGNYRKALEIITELNLKNSKKSVYFADQIRFLQMLIRTTEPDSE